MSVLSFDEFCRELASSAHVESSSWTPGSTLEHDLALDSMQMLELVVFMDTMGAEVFEELLPHLRTLDDLYDHYVTRISAENPR